MTALMVSDGELLAVAYGMDSQWLGPLTGHRADWQRGAELLVERWSGEPPAMLGAAASVAGAAPTLTTYTQASAELGEPPAQLTSAWRLANDRALVDFAFSGGLHALGIVMWDELEALVRADVVSSSQAVGNTTVVHRVNEDGLTSWEIDAERGIPADVVALLDIPVEDH